jgi:hypothetical protein
MRLGLLLRDPGHDVLFDGWRRPPYQPRHGKPPALARAVRSAVTAVGPVLERYLGAGEDEPVPGAARPAS